MSNSSHAPPKQDDGKPQGQQSNPLNYERGQFDEMLDREGDALRKGEDCRHARWQRSSSTPETQPCSGGSASEGVRDGVPPGQRYPPGFTPAAPSTSRERKPSKLSSAGGFKRPLAAPALPLLETLPHSPAVLSRPHSATSGTHSYPPVPPIDAVHATGTAENAQSRTSGLGEVADEDLERRREAAQLELVGRADGTVGKGPWWRLRKERWHLVVSFAIIALVGMNDSATGANLDSMREYYGVTYDKISLVFLAQTAGYFLSSMAASPVVHHFGIQVSLGTACAGMATGCIMLSVAPPFGIFVASLIFLGFGSGMYDACITTIISHADSPSLMSFTYAFFGIGAFASPLLIGSFVDRDISWNFYYTIPCGLSLVLAVGAFFAFRDYETPPDEAHDAPPSSTAESEVVQCRAKLSSQERMKRALRIRAVWIGFVLIILSFASTNTLSGWMISWFLQQRSSPAAATRYILSGLWAGIAVGRIALTAVFDKRLGERTFTILTLACASAALAILYVRSWAVDAVAMFLSGIFIGPVTPRVLSTVAIRVPPSLKGSTMSLTIGLGLIGSSTAPLLFGVVASRGGLATLPAVVMVASGLSMLGWVAMPKNRRRED